MGNEWEMSDGSLGESYAYQLNKTNNQGRNQVDQLLYDIKHSPLSQYADDLLLGL